MFINYFTEVAVGNLCSCLICSIFHERIDNWHLFVKPGDACCIGSVWFLLLFLLCVVLCVILILIVYWDPQESGISWYLSEAVTRAVSYLFDWAWKRLSDIYLLWLLTLLLKIVNNLFCIPGFILRSCVINCDIFIYCINLLVLGPIVYSNNNNK